MAERSPKICPSRMLSRLEALVSLKSFLGSEAEAIELVRKWLSEMPKEVVEVDSWRESLQVLQKDPSYPKAQIEREEEYDIPVVVGRIVGNKPGKKMLLCASVDVAEVSPSEHWSNDPFHPTVIGTRVFGRGTCKAKAGVVAALEVFENVANYGKDFEGELLIVIVPGSADGGTGSLAAIRRGYAADYAVILDPTNGLKALPSKEENTQNNNNSSPSDPAIVVAQAGCISLSVTITGKASSASFNYNGVSALDKFVPVMIALQESQKEANNMEAHPLMSNLQLPYPTNIGSIHGGLGPNSVLDNLVVRVRAGVLLGETVQQAIERVTKAISNASKQDIWLESHPPVVETCNASTRSVSITSDHELVTSLQECTERVLGKKADLAATPYPSDMALWRHVAQTPTLLYGPGDVQLACTTDESVPLEEVGKVSYVLVNLVATLLQHKGIPQGKDMPVPPTMTPQQESPSQAPPQKPTRGWFRSLFHDLVYI